MVYFLVALSATAAGMLPATGRPIAVSEIPAQTEFCGSIGRDGALSDGRSSGFDSSTQVFIDEGRGHLPGFDIHDAQDDTLHVKC